MQSHNASLKDHCEKEAVSAGRWAPEEPQGMADPAAGHSVIFWGTEEERWRPLYSLGKPPFLLKAKRKGGVSE